MTDRPAPVRRILKNGLTVLAERRGLGPVVFSGVVYSVGSRDEGPGITGISHVLEHMMFKGTKKYAKGEVAAIVERNGGDLNAFTSEDVTMYYEVFARDRWTLALEIESERMANLEIDATELESERQVILEERVMYLDIPAVELSEELAAAALRESPYRWPVIGWEADIRAITRDDLMSHYRKYYSPGNAALIVVGDVDPDEVFEAAEAHFGHIEPSEPIVRRIPIEPEFRTTTRVNVSRQANLPQLQILFRAPEIRTRDSEALYLLSNILSGTRTSRLDLALLETNRAGDVHVQYSARTDPSTLVIGVEGHPGVPIDEAEEIVWEELDRVSQDEVGKDELERAINQVEAHHLFSMQSPSNRGFMLGWHEALGDVEYADRIISSVRSLTPADLKEAAQRYFTRERCGVGTLTASAGVVASREVAPSVAAWKPGGLNPHGVFSPSRRYRSGVAATPTVERRTLANGMKVLLQPDHTDPVVSVSFLAEAGSVRDEPGFEGLAHLTAETIERGTSKLSFVDFNRQFERLGSSLSLGAGSELVHGGATFLARHLETGLPWLADLLEDPGFREADLDVVRALALNDLAARDDDLDDVAEDLFLKGVAQDHPYGLLPHGTERGLQAATTEKLREFRARAYRPDGMHLAIVGDFSVSAVEKLLETRFGKLAGPDGAAAQTPAMTGPVADQVFVQTRQEKSQAKIFLGTTGLSVNDSGRLAGIMMNQILGGSAIRSRLGDEIRDKQGLAYSVYSRNYERSQGGFFVVHMGTRAENVRRAVDSISGELRKMAQGVTEQELDDARDYLTGSFPLRFTTYGRLARFWARSSFYGWPEDYLATYVDRVRATTADDVAAVAGRISTGARVLAVAGPVGDDLEPVG